MSPSPPDAGTTTAAQTIPRQIGIPAQDWHDLKHAVRAAEAERATSARQTDRAAVIRQYMAWRLGRAGVTLPERPAIKDWSRAAKADTDLPSSATPYRKVRIGNDWDAFGRIVSDRSGDIAQFVAWYLRRKGASLPQAAKESLAEQQQRAEANPGQIGIDPDLEFAARAAGLDPQKVISSLVAWYLRRPASPLPQRPALTDWANEAREATRPADWFGKTRGAVEEARAAAAEARAVVEELRAAAGLKN